MSQYVKYLVYYDVTDNKSRTKFSNALKDLGLIPIQKSVFYGDLKPPEARSISSLAKKFLNEETDSCFWFPCHLDLQKLRSCFGLKDFQYEEPDGFKVL